MPLNKIKLSFLLSIMFLFSSHITFSQSQSKDLSTQKEVIKPLNKSGKMKVAKGQTQAKPMSRKEKEKKYELTKQKRGAKKSNRLYSSKSRIERAKMDLSRKVTAGKLTKKEAQIEETKIKKSETELQRKSKNTSTFSKKLENVQPVNEN